MLNKVKLIVGALDKKLFNGLIRKIVYKLYDNTSKRKANSYHGLVKNNYINKKREVELKNIDPKGLVCSDRLDIIVRYLLFRDISFSKENDIHKSLYCRTILSRTGANEPLNHFSEKEKNGIEAHLVAARALCESMKKKGFEQDCYVPVAEDYGLYNGAHRLACAMALNENVWIKECGEHGVRDMDFKWFSDNGFSTEDKIRILRGFADIHRDCGIFVLWGTAQSKWEYIQTNISRKMKIVGFVDLDFSKDYIAFENLVHDIYQDYKEESCITEKIHLLKFSNLVVRIILVSDEYSQDNNLYECIRETKAILRKCLEYDYPNDAYVTLHASDTREEFIDLKNTVLSVNNLRYLSLRRNCTIRNQFYEWLLSFKEYCHTRGIDIADTCIVGSSPLEVLEIRNSTDIDIVIAPELRNIYGDGITHLTPTLDIVTRNYIRNDKECIVYDEQLIYDDNYHFMFMGCKFVNAEYVLYRKNQVPAQKTLKMFV